MLSINPVFRGSCFDHGLKLRELIGKLAVVDHFLKLREGTVDRIVRSECGSIDPGGFEDSFIIDKTVALKCSRRGHDLAVDDKRIGHSFVYGIQPCLIGQIGQSFIPVDNVLRSVNAEERRRIAACHFSAENFARANLNVHRHVIMRGHIEVGKLIHEIGEFDCEAEHVYFRFFAG